MAQQKCSRLKPSILPASGTGADAPVWRKRCGKHAVSVQSQRGGEKERSVFLPVGVPDAAPVSVKLNLEPSGWFLRLPDFRTCWLPPSAPRFQALC